MPQGRFTWTPDDAEPEAVPEEPGLWERIGGLQGLAAGGTRALSGVLSSSGGWPGMAISGGGEALAQMIEEGNPLAPFQGEGTGRIAAETAIGAVPFGRVFRAGMPVAAAATRGALYGGGGEFLRETQRDDGEIDPLAIAGHTAFGGGLGALMGKFMKPPTLASGPPKPQYTPGPKLTPAQYTTNLIRDQRNQVATEKWLLAKRAMEQKAVDTAAKAVATAKRDADAATRIATEAKALGLTPGDAKISESVSAPTATGTQRMVIPYKGADDADDVADAVVDASRAPRRADPITGAPAAPPENPFVAAAVKASTRGAPKSPLEALLTPKVADVVEDVPTTVPTAPIPDPVLPTPVSAVPEPPVASLDEPGEFVPDLIQLLKSRGSTSGKNYRLAQDAVKRGEIPTAEYARDAAMRELPATNPKRIAWERQNALPPAASATAVPTPSTGTVPSATPTPASAISHQTEYGADATTAADKLAGASGAREMNPDEIAEQLSFIDRIKKFGQDETGGIRSDLATRLGLGAAGAAIGGATDPLGDPLLSAAAGGAAGFMAPVAVKLLQRGAFDPALGPEEKAVAGMLSTPDGPTEIAKSVWETLPQYFRANYLMNPNLMNNVVTGPYGAGFTAAMEYRLAGDPRGAALMSELRPDKWAQEFATTWAEAEQLIGATERAGGELVGEAPTLARRVLASPGTLMTMGDVTTRRIAERMGFSADEARRITMTNEPEFNFMRRLANLPRGSTVGQIALPFSRTLANIVEQGSMRLPGIGSIVQANRAVPDDLKTQLVQQAVGGGAGLAGAAAGYYGPEEGTAGRLTRGFASNIAGRAALPAAMGFAAGRAARGGGTGRDIAKSAVQQGLSSLPLPTVETPVEWAQYLLAEPGEGVLPRSAVPGVFREMSENLRLRRPGAPAAAQAPAGAADIPTGRFNWSP